MSTDVPYEIRLRKALVAGITDYRGARRRHRIHLISILAMFVLGYSVSVATGAINWRLWPIPDDLPPGVEPRPIGLEKLITQGTVEVTGPSGVTSLPWRFTAFESDKGLCIHVEDPRSKGGGCGFGVPDVRAISIVTSHDPKGTFVYGPVVKEAVRVEVTLASGESLSLEPLGESLGFEVNFYIVRLEGRSSIRSVVAYDSNGRRLGFASGEL